MWLIKPVNSDLWYICKFINKGLMIFYFSYSADASGKTGYAYSFVSFSEC